MIALLGGLAAAWAAITALHLRSRPRGGAAPFPSFQHLEGLAPRRRPAWPLEEPVRFALRVVSLGLVAAALLLARRADRRPLVVLVEPGSPRWDDARALVAGSAGPALALTLDGDRAVVESTSKALEAGERARRALGSCSATPLACLVRAAGELEGEVIVVSSFEERGETLGRLGRFRYLRTARGTATALPAALASAAPAPAPARHVTSVGRSPAARIWAAALEVAEARMGTGGDDLTVVDSLDGAEGRAGLSLVPLTVAAGVARARPVGGVALSEDAALAAGVAALDPGSSLALADDASLRPLVAPVLARRGRTILAAASEEDLGRWAHGPTLVALARVILLEAGRVALRDEPPVGGLSPWKGGAPLGLADVAPGHYVREDGRAEVTVSREARRSGPPLDDASLAARGGTRIDDLPAPRAPSRWPLALLVVALALRVADAPRGRAAAVVPFAVVLALVALLALDGSLVRSRAVRRVVETSGSLSLPGAVRDATCARPGALRPCVVTSRAAFAGDGTDVNAVVFRAGRPRVDIVSWELPAEIRAGEAGLLRATLDVRRAAGREVTLSVRPTSGLSAETTRKIASEREVVSLDVRVRPAAEGVSFALVRAGIGEDGDALVVPVVTRSRPARRLVLAAAPTWEARAAGEALARRGDVERLTRLGATAVIARGGANAVDPIAVDPMARLAGSLAGIDLVVLTGFTREDLAGRPEAALVRFVGDGGALLFLGEPPRLTALPLPSTASAGEESLLPSTITGTLGGRRASFLGFPAWRATLPVGGVVLGRLGDAPWIVGRSVGKGRIAALTAPDLWRAGPGYEALLGDLIGWLEAGRGGGGVVLTPDLRTLVLGDSRVALPASEIAGLAVDPIDPFALLPPGRGRQRVEAIRRHVPFLEPDTPAELTSLLSRFPEPEALPRRLFARDVDAIWLALAGLVVVEVWLRRRAGARVTRVTAPAGSPA